MKIYVHLVGIFNDVSTRTHGTENLKKKKNTEFNIEFAYLNLVLALPVPKFRKHMK